MIPLGESLKIILTIIGSVLASSGFWSFIQSRRDKKDTRTQMLIGLAHDRIMYLGTHYLDRGYITHDEYENLHDYLYIPYAKMGGNGSAAHVMERVDKLPIHKANYNQKN